MAGHGRKATRSLTPRTRSVWNWAGRGQRQGPPSRHGKARGPSNALFVGSPSPSMLTWGSLFTPSLLEKPVSLLEGGSYPRPGCALFMSLWSPGRCPRS